MHSTPQQMTSQWTKAFWRLLAVLATLLTLSGGTHAASIDLGGGPGVFTFFDPFDAIAKGQGTTFMNKITALVTNTFWILAVIELAWSASLWVIEKDNMNALMAEMLQKIMFIAFFFLLLQKGPEWFPIIIDSFRDAGQQTIGNVVTNADGSLSGAPLSPDTIVATGFATVNVIWANSPFKKLEEYKNAGLGAFFSKKNPVKMCMAAVNIGAWAVKVAFNVIKIFTPDAIDDILDAIVDAPCRVFVFLYYLPQIVCALLATVVVAVAHVVIAVQLLALNIESYVLLAAGAIFLGLGSSRWTNEYTTKLFSYALNVGFRLLVLILVLGLTKDLVTDALKEGFEFEIVPLLKLAGLSLLQMLLAIKAPDMANALMSGGSSGMSVGGMVESVRSVSDASKMLKNAVQAPGKAVNSGVNTFTKTKDFLKGSSNKKDSGSVKGL
jgi:P-type conjugative transfer protein TrbL